MHHFPGQICDSNSLESQARYKIYNIGNHKPITLIKFIEVIEATLGKKANLNMKPMQPGDVLETYADVSDLIQDVGFSLRTSIEDGITKFVRWYQDYYLNQASLISTNVA